MSPTFASLRTRNYRLYFTGGLVSNIGTWLQRVAQDWLVYQLTHSGTAVGIVTGLQFVSSLVLSPYAGLIADRFPKRTMMACTQAAMSVCALTLGVLTMTGLVRVWQVMLIAFLFGIAAAFDAPARQSFVMEMVGKKSVTNAVALNSTSFNAGRLIGPGAAGLLIGWLGSGPAIFLNGLSYAGVLISLWMMRPEELFISDRAPHAPGMLREGFAYIWQRPQLTMVLIVMWFAGTFGLNFQITSVLMSTGVFGEGATEYGILGSVLAVGSLCGALLAARRKVIRPRLVIAAAIAFGVMEIVNGSAPTYWSYLAMLPLIGVLQMTMLNSANATMQLGVEPMLRGRVMAIYMTVMMGGTAIGGPVIGWIGQHIGPRWGLIGGGILTLVGTLIAVAYYSRSQRLRPRPQLRPWPHVDMVPVRVSASSRV